MAVDRRKQIVEAASKSFALFGYKATTMEQVAKLANVGKGTIYTFFTNKEELFDEIVKVVIEQLRDLAKSLIQSDKPSTYNLHRFLFSALEFRREHEFVLRLTHEVKEMGTAAAIEGIMKIEKAIISYVTGMIQDAIDQGEFKPCDPERTAFAMFKMYIAFVFDWESTHEPLSKEEILELFNQYFIRGLAIN